MGWIAVDFDGTLVTWGEGHNHDVMKVGRPIEKMIDRVRGWLAEGKDVRIFTARIFPGRDEEALEPLRRAGVDLSLMEAGQTIAEAWVMYQTGLIDEFCKEHFGRALPVTCTKDFHMIELWDDRCMQVAPNQGYSVMDVALEYSGKIHYLLTTHGLYGPEGYTFPDGDLWTPDPKEESV